MIRLAHCHLLCSQERKEKLILLFPFSLQQDDGWIAQEKFFEPLPDTVPTALPDSDTLLTTTLWGRDCHPGHCTNKNMEPLRSWETFPLGVVGGEGTVQVHLTSKSPEPEPRRTYLTRQGRTSLEQKGGWRSGWTEGMGRNRPAELAQDIQSERQVTQSCPTLQPHGL